MRKFIFVIFVITAYSFGQGQEAPVQFVPETPLQFDRPVVADQYIIRPGDVLTVTFLRANLEPLKLVVDPEGRVIHGNLGLFDLSHSTLTQAKEKLLVAAKNLYKIENVIISITDPIKVRFSITGAVKEPGVYQGYTSQRVSDAIKMAGGVLPGGSTRRILFSGGPHDIWVDLDLAEFTGDIKSDPCLYAGYTIYVPQKFSHRIQIIGEVNNPREIELHSPDNLNLLIALAGGYRNWADSNNIQIIRNGNVFNAQSETIQPGDIIKVNPLSDIPVFQTVLIFGAVANPGKFQAAGIPTLGELLEKAGGFVSKATKTRTSVFRFNSIDATGRISTNRSVIQNILIEKGPGVEFKLVGGDSVFVPYQVGYVEVDGLVLNPGTFPFQADKTAEYYINLAGGYLDEADRLEIDVYDEISKITSRHSAKIQIHDGFKITVNIRKGLE